MTKNYKAFGEVGDELLATTFFNEMNEFIKFALTKGAGGKAPTGLDEPTSGNWMQLTPPGIILSKYNFDQTLSL